jgi:hypothetical protein
VTFLATVGVYWRSMSDTPIPKGQQHPPATSEAVEKPRKEIPMVSVPNDRDMMADEMTELFDEDRVTHQHGSSEPEAD